LKLTSSMHTEAYIFINFIFFQFILVFYVIKKRKKKGEAGKMGKFDYKIKHKEKQVNWDCATLIKGFYSYFIYYKD